jgi:hypothetical protein
MILCNRKANIYVYLSITSSSLHFYLLAHSLDFVFLFQNWDSAKRRQMDMKWKHMRLFFPSLTRWLALYVTSCERFIHSSSIYNGWFHFLSLNELNGTSNFAIEINLYFALLQTHSLPSNPSTKFFMLQILLCALSVYSLSRRSFSSSHKRFH